MISDMNLSRGTRGRCISTPIRFAEPVVGVFQPQFISRNPW